MPAPLRTFLPFLLCTALPAAALPEVDGACSTRPVQWLCIGQLEVRANDRIVRMSGYDKQEMMVEAEVSGKRSRMLVTPRGEFVDARPSGPDFAFWGYAFAAPLMALPVAYPDGPHSVPVEPATNLIDIERNKKATVTAWRMADGEIRFRIVLHENAPTFEGSYRAGLKPALPGDFDLRGWYVPLGPQKIGEPPPQPQPSPVERLEQLR